MWLCYNISDIFLFYNNDTWWVWGTWWMWGSIFWLDPHPLPCENLEVVLNLCLVLKEWPLNNIQLHYYFCNYNSFIILENIMKTPELFVHRWQTSPSPRSNNHGRGQLQENVLLGRMGKGEAIKYNECYNCVKSVYLAKCCRVGKITCWKCGGGGTRNVCPSKYKIATKTDKKEGREIIFIQTANISNSTL